MGLLRGASFIVAGILAMAGLNGCAPLPLVDALVAPGPVSHGEERLSLYGQFVGEWDIRVVNHADDGSSTVATGEWVFGWVLEGRAVQDAWIVPARAQRDPRSARPGPYGTTLRIPDAQGPGWQIVWVNPVSGTVERMRAGPVGDRIVQDGRDADGRPFRWVFHSIGRGTFQWLAEEQSPGGGWRLNQEITATRRR